jgi:thiamine-phosphate pyrophosphorylase
MVFRLPKLYPITDRRLTGLSHAEQVERLCRGGAELIQLREKEMTPRQFYEEAVRAVEVAKRHEAKIIINDRVDIAIAVEADGVHLGQDDLPPFEARQILGDRAIIGFSTHSLSQTVAAEKLPIDYLAIGPIFTTQTKVKPDPALGLQGLRAITQQLIHSHPLVAIGGIRRETVTDIMAAGTDSVAIMRDLLFPPDQIEAKVRAFVKQI